MSNLSLPVSMPWKKCFRGSLGRCHLWLGTGAPEGVTNRRQPPGISSWNLSNPKAPDVLASLRESERVSFARSKSLVPLQRAILLLSSRYSLPQAERPWCSEHIGIDLKDAIYYQGGRGQMGRSSARSPRKLAVSKSGLCFEETRHILSVL